MFGGLAQLVERLLCKQDVSGSSPLTSTDRTSNDLFGAEFCTDVQVIKLFQLVRMSLNMHAPMYTDLYSTLGEASSG